MTLTRSRGLFAAPGRGPALFVLALMVLIRAIDPGVVQSLRLRGFDFRRANCAATLPAAAGRRSSRSTTRAWRNTDSGRGRGRWWRKLVDKIAAGKPRVLGVDIIFAEPDRLSPGRLVDSDPEIPANVAGELAQAALA